MQDRNWRALIVYSMAMCISMALPVFGGSVVYTAMSRVYGWDATSLGLLVVTKMLTSSLLLPGAANVAQKLGVRACMAIGFVSMASGAALLATVVTTPYEAMVAYGVLMGVTSAFSGVIPCQIGVAAWFPNRRTSAFSLLYAITGVLAFGLIALLGIGIERSGDWRFGWYVFGAAAIVGFLSAVVFVRDAPATANGDGSMMASQGRVGYSELGFGAAAHSLLFAVIVISLIGITSGTVFLAAHVQSYLLSLGFSVAKAASALSVMQIGMVIGNLSFGLLAHRLALRKAMAAALFSFAFSFLILANVQGYGMLLLFAITAGMGFGAGQVGAMALIGHYWDKQLFPMLSATALMIQSIVSASVPALTGRYYDSYGSYLPPIYAMMLAFVAIGAAIILAGKEPKSAPAASK